MKIAYKHEVDYGDGVQVTTMEKEVSDIDNIELLANTFIAFLRAIEYHDGVILNTLQECVDSLEEEDV